MGLKIVNFIDERDDIVSTRVFDTDTGKEFTKLTNVNYHISVDAIPLVTLEFIEKHTTVENRPSSEKHNYEFRATKNTDS